MLIIMSVRDVQVDGFQQPFTVPAIGAGTRVFADEVNRSGSSFNSHPEDYILFEVGRFDETTGVITPLAQPKQIVSAVACLNTSH